MRWGNDIDTLLQLQEESGIVPHALARRPKLPKELVYYYKVWQSLSSSRVPQFSGVGGIPYSEFFLYAYNLGYRGSELLEFWDIVHLIDVTFTSELAKIQKEEAPKPGSKK